MVDEPPPSEERKREAAVDKFVSPLGAAAAKFELAIVLLIFLNMIAMAVEHYNQSSKSS